MDYRTTIIYAIILVSVFAAEVKAYYQFNEDTTGVWFNRPGTKGKRQDGRLVYDRDELMILMQKVSSRFRTLMMSSGNVGSATDRTLAEYPSVVANINSLHLKEHEKPLELLMHFDPDGHRSDYPEGNHFDVVRQAADSANSIFPNTVKTLLLSAIGSEWAGPKFGNLSQVATELSQYRNRSTSHAARFQYKLGATLPRESCEPYQPRASSGGGEFTPEVASIISQSEVLFFANMATERQLALGVEAAFPEFTSYFESCKERVLQRNPNVEVGFLTGWPDTSKSGVQNVSSLVDFWRRMNTWSAGSAQSTSTKVIFLQAFDIHYDRGVPRNWATVNYVFRGWWRLNESRSSNLSHASGFLFDEKLDDLKVHGEYLEDESDEVTLPPGFVKVEASEYEVVESVVPPLGGGGSGSSGAVTTTTVLLISVSLIILLLLLLLGAGALVVFFFLRRRKRHQPGLLVGPLHYVRETNELLSGLDQEGGDE